MMHLPVRRVWTFSSVSISDCIVSRSPFSGFSNDGCQLNGAVAAGLVQALFGGEGQSPIRSRGQRKFDERAGMRRVVGYSRPQRVKKRRTRLAPGASGFQPTTAK